MVAFGSFSGMGKTHFIAPQLLHPDVRLLQKFFVLSQAFSKTSEFRLQVALFGHGPSLANSRVGANRAVPGSY